MSSNQPVWVNDGEVAATPQGYLGLGSLSIVPKNDTRRLIGKQVFIIVCKEPLMISLDQFFVQVRRPGVVALQSAKNTKCFLSIKKGMVSANVSVMCVSVCVMCVSVCVIV